MDDGGSYLAANYQYGISSARALIPLEPHHGVHPRVDQVIDELDRAETEEEAIANQNESHESCDQKSPSREGCCLHRNRSRGLARQHGEVLPRRLRCGKR
jgi:hypothetical protein